MSKEPIIRRVSDSLTDRAHQRRASLDGTIKRTTPSLNRGNLGDGRGVGIITAAIAVIVEDTVGIPFGATSDIVFSESVEEGTKYTVNVNAPFENMAEARASIDSSTGFTSFLTDEIDVQSVSIERTRVLRDTFQVDILVRE